MPKSKRCSLYGRLCLRESWNAGAHIAPMTPEESDEFMKEFLKTAGAWDDWEEPANPWFHEEKIVSSAGVVTTAASGGMDDNKYIAIQAEQTDGPFDIYEVKR